jgi:hypothetical protein
MNIFKIKKIIEKKTPDIYAALVLYENEGIFNEGIFKVYLVNETDETLDKVHLLSGGFNGTDDVLIETSKFTKEIEVIQPQSAVVIDQSDIGELDEFTIWYHLDIYQNGEVRKFWFELPKLIYIVRSDYEMESIPLINEKGIILKLNDRKGA